MYSNFNKFIRRTVAGISALSIIMGSYAATADKYIGNTFSVKADDKSESELLYGDFNCDGKVDVVDIEAMNKYLKDADSVTVTEQGLKNGDVFKPGSGISFEDVQAIVESLANKNKLPAEKLVNEAIGVVYGDVNCDGAFDQIDVSALNRYLKSPDSYPLTAQGLINADVYKADKGVTNEDVQAMLEALAGKNKVPTDKLVTGETEVIYGDVNHDGAVDHKDVSALNKYLKSPDTYPISEQGLKNADVYKADKGVTNEDVQALLEALAGKNTLPTDKLVKGETAVIYGDANCDSVFNQNDIEALNRYLKSPDSYPLTAQGLINADVYKADKGVTNEDAQAMLEALANKNKLPTDKLVKGETAIVYGDVNHDGAVDHIDVEALNRYLKSPDTYPVSEQGLKNADVYKPGSGVTEEDIQALLEALANKNKLPTEKLVSGETTTVYGDANCDSVVDYKDVEALNKYLKAPDSYPLTAQGLINADAFKPGEGIDSDDVQAIMEFIANKTKLPADSITSIPKKNVKYGDFNCDGKVDVEDAAAMNIYVTDKSDVKLSEEALVNGDVYDPGSGITEEDVEAVTKSLSALVTLPVFTKDEKEKETLYGDFDCDGKTDYTDAILLNSYLEKGTEYVPSTKGLTNADAFVPGFGVDFRDVALILEYAAGINELPADNFKSKAPDTVYGDFDCDGKVDTHDVILINNYNRDRNTYSPSAQGIANADAYVPGFGLDFNDVALVTEFIVGISELPGDSFKRKGAELLYGDFDCDGKVDTYDVLLLDNYLKDTSTYSPSAQGIANADVYVPGFGLDFNDVALIAEYIAGINELPNNKLNSKGPETVYGDFDCDGKVDVHDIVLLDNYLKDTSTYSPSAQGLANADAYVPGFGDDENDVALIAEYIAGINELPCNSLKRNGAELLYGDFDCDGKVDVHDIVLLDNYLKDTSTYSPSAQGLANADVYVPGFGVDENDVALIAEYIAGISELPGDSFKRQGAEKVPGDFNCDGKINTSDAVLLTRYLGGDKEYAPSNQGLSNADLDTPGFGINYKDLAEIIKLIAEGPAEPVEDILYGDANCDKNVDLSDSVLIMQSIANPSKFKLTEQGRKNADCCNPGDGVTNFDALSIQKYMLLLIDKLPEITK